MWAKQKALLGWLCFVDIHMILEPVEPQNVDGSRHGQAGHAM